jgi:2-oxo-4-hydroxy-4-carboxy-5-ureidoimidazoline decarboxylase
MNGVLARWNELGLEEAMKEIVPCCGSSAWAHKMAARRPIAEKDHVFVASDDVWNGLAESDWDEAFRSHPRIGEEPLHMSNPAKSAAWSAEEQRKVGAAADDIKSALAEGNRRYEQRFRRIFIVCASGKSAPEILRILERRLSNDERTELREAAEQQRQITQLRLQKWLGS